MFGYRLVNKMFGKEKRTKEEVTKLERFVGNLMCGCGWDCKGPMDFLMFRKEFLPLSFPAILQQWYEDHGEDRWPVVEKQDGEAVWAWFEKGIRVTEWVNFSKE